MQADLNLCFAHLSEGTFSHVGVILFDKKDTHLSVNRTVFIFTDRRENRAIPTPVS